MEKKHLVIKLNKSDIYKENLIDVFIFIALFLFSIFCILRGFVIIGLLMSLLGAYLLRSTISKTIFLFKYQEICSAQKVYSINELTELTGHSPKKIELNLCYIATFDLTPNSDEIFEFVTQGKSWESSIIKDAKRRRTYNRERKMKKAKKKNER